ncbi:hypothetical protein [Haladaptatus halobius]|uniref:hypothetical protein n=1 Tax=Haladaptatus halobius TaxID=2884875 RepID=UPI001D0A0FDB|nr:hypothetical protein [Haladaptatus halobius]
MVRCLRFSFDVPDSPTINSTTADATAEIVEPKTATAPHQPHPPQPIPSLPIGRSVIPRASVWRLGRPPASPPRQRAPR